jgi:hypothetical protein
MRKFGVTSIVGGAVIGLSALGWLLDWTQRMEQLALLIGKIPDGVRWLDAHHASLWLYPLLLALGLFLVWWDVRRRHDVMRMVESGGQALGGHQPTVLSQASTRPALEPPPLDTSLATVSREARALAEVRARAERANSEAITEVSKPVRLRVSEAKNATATHLVLTLELLTPEPTDQYALHVLDVALWYAYDGGSYSTIARFAESAKPWEITICSGAARLHRNAAAAYNLCTFASGPHVEYVAGGGRTTCKLEQGLYRFKLEFCRAGHVHPHESFVRVDAEAAEFAGHD